MNPFLHYSTQVHTTFFLLYIEHEIRTTLLFDVHARTELRGAAFPLFSRLGSIMQLKDMIGLLPYNTPKYYYFSLKKDLKTFEVIVLMK